MIDESLVIWEERETVSGDSPSHFLIRVVYLICGYLSLESETQSLAPLFMNAQRAAKAAWRLTMATR